MPRPMLSKPVYEALPALYVMAGMLSLAALDSGIKYPSGVLLIAAGLLVWSWRRQARRRKAPLRKTAAHGRRAR